MTGLGGKNKTPIFDIIDNDVIKSTKPTLQPSQVKAPKWKPAAGSPHTLHCWFIWNKTTITGESLSLMALQYAEHVIWSGGIVIR